MVYKKLHELPFFFCIKISVVVFIYKNMRFSEEVFFSNLCVCVSLEKLMWWRQKN